MHTVMRTNIKVNLSALFSLLVFTLSLLAFSKLEITTALSIAFAAQHNKNDMELAMEHCSAKGKVYRGALYSKMTVTFHIGVHRSYKTPQNMTS